MNILTFSSLYPNSVRPSFGVFVETRLRHLVASGEVESQVVAPVPWFPLGHRRFGEWSALRQVPARERRAGLTVHHPRFVRLPKVGMSVAPLTMYLSLRPFIRRLLRQKAVDLIDAHYFYPDGVAAVMLGKEFELPVVITGRGTDLNLIPDYALPRRQIRWAAEQAAGLVTVCAALAEPLVRLGIPRDKVTVLRNGVDLSLFTPQDRGQIRAEMGLAGPVLLSVGWLIPRKGHHIAIDALSRLPGVTLLIAGSGPEGEALAALARTLGVDNRVRFLGQVEQQRLPSLYSAADALLLASDREGWANVLLEAMACGTPVVASDVWGTAEAVTAPEAGRLFSPLDAPSLAAAIARLLADPPARAATRAYAEQFSWDETTRGQIELFRNILSSRKGVTPAKAGVQGSRKSR
jgi:glycosyltransferase involved in cell wall biosynthesis